MCVTWCIRRGLLFFNHEDCANYGCPFAEEAGRTCEGCRHRQGELCVLTRAPLPKGGCCHRNVEPVSGPQRVTKAMLSMLLPGANETVRDVLDGFDVAYRIDDQGDVRVESDELGLPDIYGIGTNEL